MTADLPEKLVSDFPENRYVVTCRVAGWRGQLPGFRTYEIQELGRDDVRSFGSAWYREVLRAEKIGLLGARPEVNKIAQAETQAYAEALERSEALWQALSANEGLLRISSTPLLLSLIALVHYHQVRLPQGRAALYQDCLRVLLDLWDSQDKQLQLAGPSFNEKLLVLKAIAFHYLENDLLDADVRTLETIVARVLELLPELGAVHGKPLSQLLARMLAAESESPVLKAQVARAMAGLATTDPAIWSVLGEAREEREEEVKAAATWAWCELGRWEELGLVRVPGGAFLMGSREGEGSSNERPQLALYLPTFYIGKTPVTVAQFRSFIAESGMEPEDKKSLLAGAAYPVVRVSWWEALAYATWHGFTLPSEAEWEKDSRGSLIGFRVVSHPSGSDLIFR